MRTERKPKPETGRKPQKQAPTYPALASMSVAELVKRVNAQNPRTITEEGLARLDKSLSEFGNLSPLTYNVRTKTLLGGHQRLKVLASRKEAETPVWCVDLPKEKEQAAALQLNNTSGDWDAGKLDALLKELSEQGMPLELTGFDLKMLEDLGINSPDFQLPLLLLLLFVQRGQPP